MLSIRQATLEDAEALFSIESVSFPEAEACGLENFQKRLAVFSDSFLILELEGKPVGLIDGMVTDQMTITDDLYEDASLHNPKGAWQSVFGLAVIPSERGQGFAALLMMEFIEKARQENRKGLILTCKEALIPFYKQFGYRCLGVSDSVHGGAVWYDMVLDFADQGTVNLEE